MPEFLTLAEADQWRALNAPPRRREKSRFTNTTTNGKNIERIDTSVFIAEAGTDFEGLMIRHAEQVAQIAYGLYKKACDSQDSSEIALAMRNWSEASGRAHSERERWLELQERARTLIPVDQAKDVAGRELQSLRRELDRFDTRYAQDCNPQDPALAQRVLRGAVEGLLSRLFSAGKVVERLGVA